MVTITRTKTTTHKIKGPRLVNGELAPATVSCWHCRKLPPYVGKEWETEGKGTVAYSTTEASNLQPRKIKIRAIALCTDCARKFELEW